MDNPLGSGSVDWSLINVWCCGKFLSGVDLAAHAELYHAKAESSPEEVRCRPGGPGCKTRIARKSIEMSAEEEVEIVSPVKEAEYWSKKRKGTEQENEARDIDNSKLLSTKTPVEFTSSSVDTSDLKDTFVNTNYVKGVNDDMTNLPLKVTESSVIIKAASIAPLNVTSKEIIGSDYQNLVLPTAPEPVVQTGSFVTCEEVPPMVNFVEANVEVKKALGRPKLNKQCDYKSKLKSNLRIHQNPMHSGVLHACDLCDYKTRRIVSLETHVKAVHEGLYYPCEICNYKGTSRVNLRLHLKLHERVTFNSGQCEKTFKYKYNLDKHNESAHELKRFSCDQCDYKAKWKHAVEIHKESIHNGITYSCNQCEFKAKHKSYLTIHKRSVHEGITYSCDQCEYKAKWKKHLKLHKESIHEGITYSCNKCNYKATQKINLKRHTESVHEGVTYSCDQCDYKANWKQPLKRHKESVHGDVTYSCDKCDYKTKQKMGLKIHKERKHSGITHTCPLCGIKLARKDYLKYHLTKKHCDD